MGVKKVLRDLSEEEKSQLNGYLIKGCLDRFTSISIAFGLFKFGEIVYKVIFN